ncbi:DNA segregation ATPase FtsK/SpoIIIE, S-DNA-T family [Flexibacter flexilis DSM 6793]|uniref:DNA segregation ATPase FtsK/SpoIIIE, S-DNA-T family n=1 Tax=Flexibacter flexilis DSM 6793 TaxID=927664 RepID=A0A1I1NS38_9BACT|nr:DNA translocase FtsK [Flexibacter flexilis]SFC96540.1 DNA segregation ATPase FtsK/SpoIIIE, S-DNA-T family [Flexibacter flexilis DSM 6793]
MAQNTYKNTPKEPQVENPAAASKSKAKSVKSIKINPTFLQDPKFKFSLGFALMLFSFAVLTALFSALFTGKADQSVVESLWNGTLRESGKEAENWLKLGGAIIAYFLMYKWFGICSFFVPPLLFAAAYRAIFKKSLINLNRITRFAVFMALWVGSLLGYVVYLSEAETSFGFLSGGIGYEIAFFFHDMIGWGTWLLLVFSGGLFMLYFFDLSVPTGKPKEEKQPTPEPVITEKPIITTSVPLIDEEEFEKNQQAEELDEETDEENLEILDQQPPVTPVLPETPKIPAEPAFTVTNTPTQAQEEDEQDKEPEFVIEKTPTEILLDDDDYQRAALNAGVGDYDPKLDLPSYAYPILDLLQPHTGNNVHINNEELAANKDKIVDTLSQYGIAISNIKATVGPTVTLYEIVPAPGVRISKIKSLEDDIALSLAALGIRIIAPIPGKGSIGIEVPNKNREMVSIRSVLANERFLKSDKELPVVLGKTISNEVLIIDLAKMPHLLMAGATGQGKSVGLNVLLASLLYSKHPSQLKFVLVDPKKVELSLFSKIERHFLAALPNSEEAIITDTKKVVNTLNSLCIEMDTRYDLLKEANCRNLREYNTKFVERKLNPEKGHKFMPYIVLVIDELADLMMTAGKEVEQPIARLAQLARAIGIHLVVATQRPSVNVITGIIKANFPARLSFRVTSKVDSRTILDTGGAEQLVGQGDMLFSQGSDLIRLQCPFVDTPEVERVCDFIGGQRGYDSAYLLPEYEGEDGGSDKAEFDPSERDALFEEAARTIVLHQQGSTSLIQRKLKLGYNRAGRLIDQLESAGIVGPFEGSKAREVLIKDEYALEQLLRKISEK